MMKKMFKKLKSQKGMTMALSIVIAVVLTTVSLSVSALVATVAINQDNDTKRNYEYLNLKNAMYDVLVLRYKAGDDNTLKGEIDVTEDNTETSTFKYDETSKTGFIYYVDDYSKDEFVLASQAVEGEDSTFQLYIAVCSDFEYGEIESKTAMRFKVKFNIRAYEVLEMEPAVWNFEF